MMEMTAEKQTSSFRFEVTNAIITATMASVIEGAATHHGQYHHNLLTMIVVSILIHFCD